MPIQASPTQPLREPAMSPDVLTPLPSRYRAASLRQVWLGRWQALLGTPRRMAQAIHLLPVPRQAAATPAPRQTA